MPLAKTLATTSSMMLLIYRLNKLGANIMFTLDRPQYSELLFCCLIFCISHSIDLLHKYHNAPVPWPTIHHFVTEMCPCVHISVTKWCIVRQLCNGHIVPRISWKCFPHHWTIFERNPLVMHGFSAQESSDGDFYMFPLMSIWTSCWTKSER